MSAPGETVDLSLQHIDETLARYEAEVANPELGRLVLSVEQIRVNSYAESYTGEPYMNEMRPDDYRVPEAFRQYNNLSPEMQYAATTRLLNGLPPEDGQFLAFQSVRDLLAATMRPGEHRAPLAFEDNRSGRWREEVWRILWDDPDYRKVRKDAQEALSDEAEQQAVWTRNLTALNIVAAISAGRYRTPPKEPTI